MSTTEKILRPRKKIRGGAHLPHHKETAELSTVSLPVPKTVILPMVQHIGAPCTPTVEVGDEVFVGTKIGDSEAFVSAPIFSSVSGKVTEIKEITLTSGRSCQAVVIESDGEMNPDQNLKPFAVEAKEDLAAAANGCGLVGLGGAGFPAKVKLTIPETAQIDTLIINAAECEPYIVSDYRECMENYENIVDGIYLLKKLLGVKDVFLCVENNKPAALKALHKAAADKRDSEDIVHVVKLKSTYPQGAEKVMIYSATGRKLPLGKLPSDVGCIVMNITSVAVLYNYIQTGMPLVSKRITVAGKGLKEPKNVLVPLGVSINEVLDFCGGLTDDATRIVMGGPMMGTAVENLDAPITKQCNAITVYCDKVPEPSPCISCGRCHNACPFNLFPAAVNRAMKNPDLETLDSLNVGYCMSCGSCAFVCPAKIPLAQNMNLAKMKQKELSSK